MHYLQRPVRSVVRNPFRSVVRNPLGVGYFGIVNPISILGNKLAAWYTRDPSTLFTTSTGETPVTAASDPVGLRVNQVSGGPDASQTTGTARPLWQTGPNRIVYDPDDALNITLPAISGGQIVISSPVGIWIDSLNFAGGTFSLGPTTYTGGPTGLMSLLDNAEMQVCILDDAMTTEEQTALVSYLVAQGSPGLITLDSEINRDVPFDDASKWFLPAETVVSGGVCTITNPTANRAPRDSAALNVSQEGSYYLCDFSVASNSGLGLFAFAGGASIKSLGTLGAGNHSTLVLSGASGVYVGVGAETGTGVLELGSFSAKRVIMP